MKIHPFTRAILGLALASSGVVAAVFPRVTAEELASQSQLIVEGSVVRSWTAWDSEHKYIWTHYEVSVTDQIRGAHSAAVTVSEPGGSLEGINQQFGGSVSYSQGENALLFLYQTPIGYWRTVGGPQGKFTVDTHGRVHANPQANTFVETPRRAAGTSLAALDGLPVRDFKARVRRLAAAYPYGRQR